MVEPHETTVETVAKTAGEVLDSIGQPALIVMVLVFGGLIASTMFIWDRQSERNRQSFVELVQVCMGHSEKQ
jgi:hypothetical protein